MKYLIKRMSETQLKGEIKNAKQFIIKAKEELKKRQKISD